MKRISFFWRVFILSFVAQAVIIFIAYFSLYLLMPGFYERDLIKKTDLKVQRLFTKINDFGNDKKCLEEFSIEHGIDILIKNTSNHIYFKIARNNLYISYDTKENTVTDSSHDIIIEDADTSKNTISIDYPYQNQKYITMTLTISLDSITDTIRVMKEIYPIAILLCVFSAPMLAFLLAKLATSPINNMRKTATRMTNLDDIQMEILTNDEYGKLGKDINTLYFTLKNTINRLEQKIQIIATKENERIDFLQAASHALKTPLTSATSLLEGMIYNIPPYNKDTKKHLKTVIAILSEANQLTKETLDLSRKEELEPSVTCDIGYILKNIVSEYNVFLISKKINCIYDMPEKMCLTIHQSMLEKILSNIISNAVKYTPIHGEIIISYYNETLSIKNTCTPLSTEAIENIFKPFIRVHQEYKEESNGLGLYIVHRLLHLCSLKYSFHPTKDGMNFLIYFK